MNKKVTLVGPYYANAPHGAEIGIYNGIVNSGWGCQIIDPRRDYNKDPDDVAGVILSYKPDFILVPGCTPNYEFLLRLKVSSRHIPIINWNAEEIRLPEYEEKVKANHHLYDKIFHFDQSALDIYRSWGINNVNYLPLGFDPARHTSYGNGPHERKPEVVFIASLGGKHYNRVLLLGFLKAAGIDIKHYSSYEPNENSRIYSKAAFSLNLTLDSGKFPVDSFKGFGLQQRIFESWGSDVPVITNYPEGYENLEDDFIINGANVLFYNKGDIVDLIKWHLARPDIYQRMSELTARLKHHHTYKKRFQDMLCGIFL